LAYSTEIIYPFVDKSLGVLPSKIYWQDIFVYDKECRYSFWRKQMATGFIANPILPTDHLGEVPASVQLTPALKLTPEQFYDLAMQNPEQPLELTANGELIVMSPTGGWSGNYGSEINFQVMSWSKQNKSGKVFDSSTIFQLPNNAHRSPDTCWIKLERWNSLTLEQKEKFPPLCPDFVIELRSKTDRIADLKNKLVEYITNGAQLGWIIDPLKKQVHIYRPGQEPVILDQPTTVSGDPELPGLVMDLTEIWHSV
jgi:Uma2 family endonuclease